jgi:hypothetical protein
MSQGRQAAVICGQPMQFRNLDRPRDDYAPVCHRPPHGGSRRLSKTAAGRAREYQRERRGASGNGQEALAA